MSLFPDSGGAGDIMIKVAEAICKKPGMDGNIQLK
jgi:hypothetical protein